MYVCVCILYLRYKYLFGFLVDIFNIIIVHNVIYHDSAYHNIIVSTDLIKPRACSHRLGKSLTLVYNLYLHCISRRRKISKHCILILLTVYFDLYIVMFLPQSKFKQGS